MKTVLITGSTDGIGKATARFYADKGYKVILHGRNKDRVLEALNGIKNDNYRFEFDYIVSDFNSFQDIKRSTRELLKKYKSIDLLINNAAIIAKEYKETIDGYESTFQINHLSSFLFTLSILPLLKVNKGSQIINISSIAHAESLNFEIILKEKYFDSYSAYEISKLANILFTYKLSRVLDNDDVFVNTLHPGVIKTKLLHTLWSGGDDVSEAVEMINYVEEFVESNKVSGEYFINKYLGETSEISYEKSIQQIMWDFSLKLIEKKQIKIP